MVIHNKEPFPILYHRIPLEEHRKRRKKAIQRLASMTPEERHQRWLVQERKLFWSTLNTCCNNGQMDAIVFRDFITGKLSTEKH